MLRWIFGALLALVGLVAIIGIGGYFALKRDDIAYETLAVRYESATSRYVDLPGGIRMHYRDEGVPGAPTLLLIHGFSASLHTWEPWVEQLSTGAGGIGDYRIVSLDLPGHGLTRAPAGYQASIENFRDAVDAFARAQGLERFFLAGSSMGGNVAWEYALAHPERVEGLILVDASGWPETRTEYADDPPVFRLLRNPIVGPILRDLDNTALARQGLENSFFDPALVTDAMVARYTELSRAPGHRDILLQITLGFRERNYATPERLAALQMPVLVMTGDSDRLVPPEHARQFADAIPNARLITFENVGHVPQEEAAEESALAAHEFMYEAMAEEPICAPGQC
ncbi:MAG: alpha/beta hydrolase [Hyphomonadaceae bacterium]|nr:alpha/beta hydrolase [Hyphomonadaceae bacterium]